MRDRAVRRYWITRQIFREINILYRSLLTVGTTNKRGWKIAFSIPDNLCIKILSGLITVITFVPLFYNCTYGKFEFNVSFTLSGTLNSKN